MAVNYTNFPAQLGAVLQVLRKRHAIIEQLRDSGEIVDNADRELLSTVLSPFIQDENQTLSELTSLLDSSQLSAARGTYTDLRRKLEVIGGGTNPVNFLGLLANALGSSSKSRAIGAIDYAYDNDDGAISIRERQGIWGDLHADMGTNGKSVKANAVATDGSFTAGDSSHGSLSWSSATFYSHFPTGTLNLVCASEDVSAPRFDVSLELDVPLPDGTKVLAGDNQLTIDKSWEDGNLGVLLSVIRSGLAAPTVTDPDNCLSGEAVATPASVDCDRGVYSLRIKRQTVSPTWIIEVYSDAARTKKRARATTDTIVGTTAISLQCGNSGSLITLTFDRAAAAAAIAAGNQHDTAYIDIKTPLLGGRWYRHVSNDYAGNFSTKLMNAWRMSLPTSGSPTFDDGLAVSESFS